MNGGAFQIDGRPVGPNHPPYIIAEMSGNHNGELRRAFALMEAAKISGADAVKLQTYTADTMTIDCDGPGFIVEAGPWKGRRLYELYQEAFTPWDWHEPLFAKGRELGISVFSSAFDASAVDFLNDLGTPAFKIASFEATDLPLIEKAASSGKPLIISTGMCSLAEIGEAVGSARRAGAAGLVLLHCVSAYPAAPEDYDLRTIPHLAEAFGVLAGLSDHTLGIAASVAATALGACVIEKHFTLRRADGGVDSTFSLEPHELEALVENTRAAHAALGKVDHALGEQERDFLPYRRSIYVVQDIAEAETLTADNVRVIRPAYGLLPKEYPNVLGRKAARSLKRGEPLAHDMII